MKRIIGIDPGVKTGVAVWLPETRAFERIVSAGIVEAMDIVKDYGAGLMWPRLFIEDAHQRKKFGKTGRERLQGAGSIKRDCSIWREFCEHHGIPFVMVPPRANVTKLDAGTFSKLTGYVGRTNEHGRDAAMLVWGM